MSLNICSLNSGSNGNCYYIGNHKEAVLIDAGLSCRETETRMKRLGLSMTNVKAIFVSHEHADHINGLYVISKKYDLPVYITSGTLNNVRTRVHKIMAINFVADNPVPIGSLVVTAFRKSHDAGDPHSFIVSSDKINVGVFTDIGFPGKELIRFFKLCDAAFLESNYCEDMLENGSYPRILKSRISGNKGHLSNAQALDLFIKHRPKQLTHLILSHLSANNNDPQLVNRLFNSHAGNTKITIASRHEETPVFNITAGPFSKKYFAYGNPGEGREQLSLF